MEEARENRSEEVSLARSRREALEVRQRGPGVSKAERGENPARVAIRGRRFEERSPVPGLTECSPNLPVGQIGYLASSSHYPIRMRMGFSTQATRPRLSLPPILVDLAFRVGKRKKIARHDGTGSPSTGLFGGFLRRFRLRTSRHEPGYQCCVSAA